MTVVHVTAAAGVPAGDYLLLGDKLVGVTAATKAASTLPPATIVVADAEQWSRLVTAFGEPVT